MLRLQQFYKHRQRRIIWKRTSFATCLPLKQILRSARARKQPALGTHKQSTMCVDNPGKQCILTTRFVSDTFEGEHRGSRRIH